MELPEKAKKLIDGKNFVVLATLMEDGSPQVSVTWVEREGNTVLINTTEDRVKTRNVRRDPRVAISIFDSNDPYDAVYLRGKVTSITKEGAEEHVDKLSRKYTGQNYRQHGNRVILRIEPEYAFVQKP
ncbi:MAG: PPOX class F420-dependent oxidoreductase [Candidatus Micrarchaeaceae archaeon]